LAIFKLNEHLEFPDVELSEEDGLLAVGGDLSFNRLIVAYDSGIFPWYSKNEPLLWWSPDPRFVLKTKDVHVSRSMKRFLAHSKWEFRINTAFEMVIENCRVINRKDQDGTWITEEMKAAYSSLYDGGKVFSFETWNSDTLIGGMYGVRCDKYFAGESMFSHESNASKFALINACLYLQDQNIELLDCQIHSNHLENLGAKYMPRKEFIKKITP
jgi:leucyl/phenylalanyl-tRNA---protein transferase